MGKKSTLPKNILNSRPIDWRWVDYNYCKYVTNMAGIKTFRQYRSWVRDYKPGGIPAHPERFYVDDWVDWKTFLETDHVYDADNPKAVREKDLLPYWDAINLIQPMQFKTGDEYKQAFDDGLIPKGIPRIPDRRYPLFYNRGGWKSWLGKDIKHRINAQKNLQPIMVLYRGSSASDNVLSVLIHTKGKHKLLELVRENDLKVVAMYNWYPDFASHVYELLDNLGNKQNDNTWIFSNIHDILFELGTVLESVKL